MKALVSLFGFSLASCMLFKAYHHLTINQTGDFVFYLLSIILIWVSYKVMVDDYRDFKADLEKEMKNRNNRDTDNQR